jgi:hypothetical protein
VSDTQSVASFHNGIYAIWNIQGHVLIQITNTGSPNAVLSGILLRTVSGTPLPAVSIISPLQNQIVTETVMVTANASSPVGIGSVQFQLDGSNLGAPQTGAGPAYSIRWSVASATNASHNLTAIATDSLGQKITSTSVTVTVSNQGFAVPSAVFAKTDAALQGNWKGTYGADGYLIAEDSYNPPTYALLNFTGQGGCQSLPAGLPLTPCQFYWGSGHDSAELPALQMANSTTDRIGAVYYGFPGFTLDVNLTDNRPHQVALYFLDWHHNIRTQFISILDAKTNAVLDNQTISAFSGGIYLVWNMQGHVLIQVTLDTAVTDADSAVVSGVFFDSLPSTAPPTVAITSPTVNQTVSGTTPLSATASSPVSVVSVQFQLDGANLGPSLTSPPYNSQWVTAFAANGPHSLAAVATDSLSQKTTSSAIPVTVSNAVVAPSAAFVNLDTVTSGSWKGKYGLDGYIIANDSNNPPSYAAASFTGATPFTWLLSTASNALQQGNSTGRIASTFYGSPSFTIDLNLIGGQTHQLALYFLDWDSSGRAETVNIVDPSTQAVLDSRTVSNFSLGQYLVWNVQGHVLIKFNHTGGPNAVVSGVFLGPPTP